MSLRDVRAPGGGLLKIAIAAGAVVTIGGYQSRVVDQLYRLPIMARMKDPAMYAADPFVRAFDTFNPHWGYGQTLIAMESLVGESAALFGLYLATLGLTVASLWRIRRWLVPDLPAWSDWLLVVLFALCRAGNIGTNHLWEDHLLDRQIGYALLWFALAEWIGGERRRAWSIPLAIGATAFIHPGLGVLAAALWTGVFGAGAILGQTKWRDCARFGLTLTVSMLPWAFVYLPQSKALLAGADPDLFWSLATELQGPQHMRPVHWRASQWWAAGAILAAGAIGFSMCRERFDRASAWRAGLWAGLILAGLLLATVLIEGGHVLGVALAQPFRLATPVRGLCLIGLTPYLVRLIQNGGVLGAARAGALVLCLRGDRAFTAALCAEFGLIVIDTATTRLANVRLRTNVRLAAWAIAVLFASWWLVRKDTADGETLLLAGNGAGAAASLLVRRWNARRAWKIAWPEAGISRSRAWRICGYAWALPIAAAIAGWADPMGESRVCQALAARWRIHDIPVSDSERLALAARSILPNDTLVLAPPRDKSFRHWSRRSVVVNVAGSPYQAKALAAWAERLRIVAGEPCDLPDFARKWPENRVPWETHYEKASAESLDAWARRFGASAIVTRRDLPTGRSMESLGWKSAARAGELTLWVPRSDKLAGALRER